MNNVIPFRGRVTAATPPVRGAVILAFQAGARAVASDATRPGLSASWHQNPDTGRLECRWSLSNSRDEAKASESLCPRCACMR